MLDKHLKDQLKVYLEKLRLPVEITVCTDDSSTSREMLELLNEIRDLSALITVKEVKDAPGRTPNFMMTRPGENTGISFASIPMGHEFTSFVLALLQTGGHPPKADPEVIEQIQSLSDEMHFETFVSLTCPNCPEVVQALNMMAVLNPKISHVMIDGALFTDEANERDVRGVPSIFLNGKELATGRMTLKEILAVVDTGSAEREARKISAKPPFDVVVVGGGPAAAAAAIYAARKGISTGLIAENIGGQMLTTTGIHNLIAVKETEGVRLSNELEDNIKSNGVDMMLPQKAIKVIPGDLIEVQLESGASVKTRTLILALGARYRELNIIGEREHIGAGVAFCAHCDGPLYKNKDVAVVGGGNAAVEAAIDLACIANHVTLLVRKDSLDADTVLQEKLQNVSNVTVKMASQPFEVMGENKKVSGLTYQDLKTNSTHDLKLDGIFVQIGQQPATQWLEGLIDLNEKGEIVTDTHGRTNVPGIFAAGDATNTPYKQIIIAMGSGAAAALTAFDYLLRH